MQKNYEIMPKKGHFECVEDVYCGDYVFFAGQTVLIVMPRKEKKCVNMGKIPADFRPKALVAGSKNEKVINIFYCCQGKGLRQKLRLHFCSFSHQTRRYVQLWGAAFFRPGSGSWLPEM